MFGKDKSFMMADGLAPKYTDSYFSCSSTVCVITNRGEGDRHRQRDRDIDREIYRETETFSDR